MNRKQLKHPLKIIVSNGNNQVFEKIFNEYPITLGRSPKTDVPLSDFDFLSRQHCCVTVEKDTIHVVDLDSANGIFFKGQKAKKVEIDGKAEIEIGELTITFELQAISSQETVIEEKTNIKPLSSIEPREFPAIAKEEESKVSNTITKQTKTEKKEKTKPNIPSALPSLGSLESVEPVSAKPETQQEIPQAPKPQLPFSVEPPKQTKEHKKPKSKVREISQPAASLGIETYSEKSSDKKPIHAHQLAAQLRPQQRVLESYVTWKDQIYDTKQYSPNSQVVVGHGEFVNLEVPVLRGQFPIASFDGMNTQVVIPDRFQFELERDNKTLGYEDLVKSQIIARRNNSYVMKLGATELVTVHVTPDVSIHLRYAPAPRPLSKDVNFFEDREVRTPAVIVGVAELLLLLVILLTETKNKETPEKIMQDRVARLIVQPKKEPPPPPPKQPEPPKPEKKVAEKRVPPKKIQPRPKKVVRLQKSKLLAKVNKYPVEVAKPMKVAEKPVVANVQQVGALAALNALSSSAPVTNQPVAININKNAGGQTALNTGGVIGTLKTSSGKLAAGGYAQVKTKGLGYGTGTGYGVQGIKGTAGGRAVAGTVVGQPSLVRLSKEEGLTRSQVMDIVKRHMTQIQQCYERSLIENPGLAGRVEYEWEISPAGRVQWAKVKKAEMSGGDALNNCVVGIFKGMKFPKATNGQNTIPNIGFPFGKI